MEVCGCESKSVLVGDDVRGRVFQIAGGGALMYPEGHR